MNAVGQLMFAYSFVIVSASISASREISLGVVAKSCYFFSMGVDVRAGK
jgi:hypothetical protein